MHENGGPEGETIARRITDRAHPARTLEALALLKP